MKGGQEGNALQSVVPTFNNLYQGQQDGQEYSLAMPSSNVDANGEVTRESIPSAQRHYNAVQGQDP